MQLLGSGSYELAKDINNEIYDFVEFDTFIVFTNHLPTVFISTEFNFGQFIPLTKLPSCFNLRIWKDLM